MYRYSGKVKNPLYMLRFAFGRNFVKHEPYYNIHMDQVVRINRGLQVEHRPVNFKKDKPVYGIYRFSIYKLSIIRSLREKKHVDFLVQGENDQERMIIYCSLEDASTISQIKYMVHKKMDQELAWYLLRGFIKGYLEGIYKLDLQKKKVSVTVH